MCMPVYGGALTSAAREDLATQIGHDGAADMGRSRARSMGAGVVAADSAASGRGSRACESSRSRHVNVDLYNAALLVGVGEVQEGECVWSGACVRRACLPGVIVVDE